MHLNPSTLLALCAAVPAVIAGPVAQSAQVDGVLKRDERTEGLSIALPVAAPHLEVRQEEPVILDGPPTFEAPPTFEEPVILAGLRGSNGGKASHSQPAKGGHGGKGSEPAKGGNGGKAGGSTPAKGGHGGKGSEPAKGAKGGHQGGAQPAKGGSAPSKGGDGGKGSEPAKGGKGGSDPGKGSNPGKGGSGSSSGKGGSGGDGGKGKGGSGGDGGKGKGGKPGKGSGGKGGDGGKGGKPNKPKQPGQPPHPITNSTVPGNSTSPSGTKPAPGKASNLPAPGPATDGKFNLVSLDRDNHDGPELEHTSVGEGFNLGGVDGGSSAEYTWNQTSTYISLGDKILAFVPANGSVPARVAAVEPGATTPLLCHFTQRGSVGLIASCSAGSDLQTRLGITKMAGSQGQYLTMLQAAHVDPTTVITLKAVAAQEED